MVAVVALPMDCLKGCAQFLQPSVADVLDEDRRLQLWDGVDLAQLSETSLRQRRARVRVERGHFFSCEHCVKLICLYEIVYKLSYKFRSHEDLYVL